MELAISNGFCELSYNELECTNAGSVGAAVVCIAAGAIGVLAGPPAAITGAVAVGCWYAGSVLIAAGGVAGAVGY